MVIGGLGLLNAFLISSFLLTTSPQESLQIVSAPITAVDIPKVVEIKSPLRIEVTSDFPNNCYSFGPTSVRLDRDRNVILFHVSAYERLGDCRGSKTSMAETIEVGQLPEGTYELRELKSLKKWGEVHIQKFETSADTTYLDQNHRNN